jgi:hypothetical protein
MGALEVVLVDPARQSLDPLVIGSVEPTVGPLAEEGLDEPLGLAVGLGAMRPGPLVAGIDRGDRPGLAIALLLIARERYGSRVEFPQRRRQTSDKWSRLLPRAAGGIHLGSRHRRWVRNLHNQPIRAIGYLPFSQCSSEIRGSASSSCVRIGSVVRPAGRDRKRDSLHIAHPIGLFVASVCLALSVVLGA